MSTSAPAPKKNTASFPTSKSRSLRRGPPIVLSGHVSTEDVAKRAGELASAYSPKVVNVLTFGPVGSQEVLLQVKFAEVDRTAMTQLGVNFVSTGAANTLGTMTTGQFGGFGPQTLGQPHDHDYRRQHATTSTATQTINNVLNLFLFRPDINFGAVIEALRDARICCRFSPSPI